MRVIIDRFSFLAATILLASLISPGAATAGEWELYSRGEAANPKWDRLVNAGFSDYDKLRVKAAAKNLEKAIAKGCFDGIVHYRLAKCYSVLGRNREALKHYERAEQLLPIQYPKHRYNYHVYNEIGKINTNMGSPQQALTYFRKAIDLNASSPDAHVGLGTAYELLGDTKKAEEEYRKAISLATNDIAGHISLANLLMEKGQSEMAMDEYRKAITLNPDNAAAHYNIGKALGQKGQLDDAIREYNLALAIDGTYVEPYLGLGITYMTMGKYKKALDNLSRAHKLAPGNILALYLKGRVYTEKGSYRRALSEFRKAMEKVPSNPEPYLGIGMVYLKQEKLDKAIDEFKKAVELDRQLSEAHKQLGWTYYRMGNYAKAVEELDLASKLAGDDPENLLLLGLARMKLLDYRAAELVFKKILTRNEKHTGAIMGLGEISLKLKKYDDAISYYEKAIEIDPNIAGTHYKLGYLYDRKGRTQEAFMEYQKANTLGSGP